MTSSACTILGTAVLALLLAGYFAQRYLPPPKPRFVGIDLGTTFSCIGVYHAVSGSVEVLEDAEQHQCIPSIVAFRGDDVIVGHKAAAQADTNPQNTIYDAKRFIGKSFTQAELESEAARYPFKLVRNDSGMVHYVVGAPGKQRTVSPEYIGSRILDTLRRTAERNLSAPVQHAVMSVPAEFSERQRNYTKMAANLAGIEVLRVINEPTAAALAYGLHKKSRVANVMVIDLGGGTLDVSLLNIQGGMFLTQAMAGNNHLGGQDFNQRLMAYLLKVIEHQYGQPLTHPEDIQSLRLSVETAKLQLTQDTSVKIDLQLHSLMASGQGQAQGQGQGSKVHFHHTVTREQFETLNMDLFKKALEPVSRVLAHVDMSPADIDEIVLVGGSTRIPRVRQMIQDYFGQKPNTSIDPELAVAHGVSIQAGILGGVWPLTVSAIEIRSSVRKIQVA